MKFIYPAINLVCFGIITLAAYNGNKSFVVVLGVLAAFWYLLCLLQEHITDRYRNLWKKSQTRS